MFKGGLYDAVGQEVLIVQFAREFDVAEELALVHEDLLLNFLFVNLLAGLFCLHSRVVLLENIVKGSLTVYLELPPEVAVLQVVGDGLLALEQQLSLHDG